MANFSETKVTGKKYRVLTDASNNKWKRISFWTAASDVELADGSTLQNFINNISSKITGILSGTDSTSTTTAPTSKLLHDQIASLKSSFQAGVDGIYNAIVAQGTTPASKSQSDVKTAIGTLATAKYNQGKSDVTLSASASGRTVTATASNGKTASASVALAGSNGAVSVSTSGGSGNQSFDITDGWCTSVNVDRTGAYNQGVTDADNRVNSSSANYKGGYNAGYSAIFNATPTRPGASVSAASSSQGVSRRTLRLSSGISYGFIFLYGGWADDTNVNFTGASISAGSLTQIANGKKQYSNFSDYGLINEGWQSCAFYIGLIRNAPSGAVITITSTVYNSLVANAAYLIKII